MGRNTQGVRLINLREGDQIAAATQVPSNEENGEQEKLNSEDAEEVAQDSFIKAFQQLNTFQGKSKFSTWLYTIVYRTAISKTRKKKLEVTDIDSYVINSYSTEGSSSQIDALTHEEQQKYIAKAIDQLPELDALLVTLFYMNDNTLDEIKDITEEGDQSQ